MLLLLNTIEAECLHTELQIETNTRYIIISTFDSAFLNREGLSFSPPTYDYMIYNNKMGTCTFYLQFSLKDPINLFNVKKNKQTRMLQLG